MTSSRVKRIKLHLDIALALAGHLVPRDIAETVEWLQAEGDRDKFGTAIEALVSRIGPRVVRQLQDEGARPEAVRAFLSLAKDEPLAQAMATLAVESRIAAVERKKTTATPTA